MAVFIFKVFSIAIKTLARPVINWVAVSNKQNIQESKGRFNVFLRQRMIGIGQTINYCTLELNRRVFGLKITSSKKTLSNDKAVERGVEFCSELIIYSICLMWPIYETIKSNKKGKKQQDKERDALINMQNELNELFELHEENVNGMKVIKEAGSI